MRLFNCILLASVLSSFHVMAQTVRENLPGLPLSITNGGVSSLCSATAPTVSGFGSSPSVPNNNGTCAFTVNVGTGGSASTGTVTLPTATTGWICHSENVTTPGTYITRQTGGTATTATLSNYALSTGIAIAWTASDVLRLSCFGY